jgi:hypothetical protein
MWVVLALPVDVRPVASTNYQYVSVCSSAAKRLQNRSMIDKFGITRLGSCAPKISQETVRMNLWDGRFQVLVWGKLDTELHDLEITTEYRWSCSVRVECMSHLQCV